MIDDGARPAKVGTGFASGRAQMIAPGDPQLRDIGEPGGRGLILYDGVCVLCSRWMRFVAGRDADRLFLFTPIQSEYGRALALKHGIDPDAPQSNAVLIDGTVNLRSDSAIAALSRLPGYGWVRMFKIVPKPARDWLYSRIARNRYRWFGRHDACDIGGAKYADRVVD
jgi:predicted DCC family thiol-disulfide oxidoreductase YuxK